MVRKDDQKEAAKGVDRLFAKRWQASKLPGLVRTLGMITDDCSQSSGDPNPFSEGGPMTYFLATTAPDKATGTLKRAYDALEGMFQMVPKVFVAQSIRPDLLDPMVTYVKRLMIDDHELPRSTKELIAAYVSTVNACAY
jgi:hypothetical protein